MTFYRGVIRGSFGSGEEWQTSIGIEDTGLSSTEDVAQDLAASLLASPQFLTQNLLEGDFANTLAVYRYATIGGPSTEVAEEPLSIEGDRTPLNGLPTQLAVVVSLRTGAPGRAKRGRMFVPFRNTGRLGGDGLIPSGNTQQIATEMAAWMSAFNNSLSGRRVVVLSQSLGQAFNITSVDVGNVVDTQRRRRNGLIESRSSAPISAL